MKKLLNAIFLATLGLTATFALAQKHSDKETQEDIAKHRAISVAHEAAAKCLETGKAHKICMKELKDACKGMAIGKFCGLRHSH